MLKWEFSESWKSSRAVNESLCKAPAELRCPWAVPGSAFWVFHPGSFGATLCAAEELLQWQKGSFFVPRDTQSSDTPLPLPCAAACSGKRKAWKERLQSPGAVPGVPQDGLRWGPCCPAAPTPYGQHRASTALWTTHSSHSPMDNQAPSGISHPSCF